MNFFEIIKKNNIIILFFLTLICMTIGFATYNQILNLTGTVTLVPTGKLEIINVDTVSLENAEATPEIINDNTSVDFNLSFKTIRQNNITYKAEFDITISNQTFNDYVFNMPDYKPNVVKVTTSGNELVEEYSEYIGWKISNASIGDKIPAKSQKTFTITFTFYNPEESAATYLIDGDFMPKVSNDEDATLMGSVADNETGNLQGDNDVAKFNIKVINTHSTAQNFSIVVKNTDKFVVKNVDNVTYTIEANSEKTFEFYLAKVDGVEYPYTSTNVDILIESQGVTYSAGSVTVLVDQTVVIVDTTAPTIRNVVATIGDTENTAQLNWDAEDDVIITYFTIYVYKQNGTTFEKVKEVQTQDSEKSILVTDLEEGTYYFTVFGTDNSGNTATASEIESATIDEGTASRSEEIELIWNFDVTINATNVKYTGETGEDVVKLGDTYTVTFTAIDYYNLPTSVTVTMGGTEYTNVDYDPETGILTIPEVAGDLVINATGQWQICLVEGTKILLADGSYKNIEDIEYTDLLAVYDHLNGGITYVYPVWIEEVGISSYYEKITFSDGTYIKVVGKHCLFDCEKNRYVDVSNEEEFSVGSKVYKIENNELKVVTAIKIEYIKERVNYYDVLSTTHYNVIANDLITTDIITQCANILYGFEEDAVFARFDEVSNSKQIEYKDAAFIPYEIFKGCNLNNILLLIENNYIDMNALGKFLLERQKEPITKNGDKYFMVTTSEDKIDSNNVYSYLYKEKSIYILPEIGAKYFIDTSTNKKYKSGESFIVYNSTHFKAVY